MTTPDWPAVAAKLTADATANALDGVVHGLESAATILSAYSATYHTPPVRALRSQLRQRQALATLTAVRQLVDQLGQQLSRIESGRKPNPPMRKAPE